MPPERRLSIDEDIRTASTLPAWVYSDPACFERQRERVFARSWQLVADLGRLRAPGQTVPVAFLEGMLEEPLVLTRDNEDRLHCLSNVCTHRGNLVCEGERIERVLRCRYHGRRFGLDGTFMNMPEFEQAKGFPSPADDLPRVPMGTLDPFVFAALDPEVPLETWLEALPTRCGWLPFGDAEFEPARSRDYLVRANWALYVDNYLEGFHIPYVHSGLNAVLDYGAYRTETFPHGVLQVGVAGEGEAAFDVPASSPDHGQRIAAYYWWLFPNTMLNLYPWGASINVIKPLAVDRTKVSYLTWIWDRSRLEQGAGAGLDRVEREDEVIVESVQRGVRSRLYDRGRYSPAREQGVHHFHRMLATRLGSDAAAR